MLESDAVCQKDPSIMTSLITWKELKSPEIQRVENNPNTSSEQDTFLFSLLVVTLKMSHNLVYSLLTIRLVSLLVLSWFLCILIHWTIIKFIPLPLPTSSSTLLLLFSVRIMIMFTYNVSLRGSLFSPGFRYWIFVFPKFERKYIFQKNMLKLKWDLGQYSFQFPNSNLIGILSRQNQFEMKVRME